MCAAYLQTEDHQAEVSLSRNLKIRVTPYVRLQELCHLNPLKRKKKNVYS